MYMTSVCHVCVHKYMPCNIHIETCAHASLHMYVERVYGERYVCTSLYVYDFYISSRYMLFQV